MKELTFSYDASTISTKELQRIGELLQPEIEQMNHALKEGYQNDRASICLCDDHQQMRTIQKVVAEKKALKPEYLIVVGIGGSNLGTIAVQEALFGKRYNPLRPSLKILYADTVDPQLIQDIIAIIEPVLKQGKNVLINAISKSGGTTETLANFQVLLNVLKKYKKHHESYVVLTTDKNSALWSFAQKHQYSVLEIPKKVGGRYSVFSPVGLFPLGMIGVNIADVLAGVHLMRDRCLSTNILQNAAALSAALLYLHKQQGKTIHNLFLFSTDLESVGKWYRQLMSESIGKQYNRNGDQVFEGITPLVSIGPTDLHSTLQLYLGGPNDKFTTFVRIKRMQPNVPIPPDSDVSPLLPVIQTKTLAEIMNAILQGVQASYKKAHRPFVEINLPDCSEQSIGQLLQMKMMEMMYLGYLLQVNPFDQPNVEDYKMETKKNLKV